MAKNVKTGGKETPNKRPAKDAKKSEKGEGGFRSNAFKRHGGSRGK
jgi:hypothetical protein